MKKFQTGSIIKVKKEYHDELKVQNTQIIALKHSCEHLAISINSRQKLFWEFLHKIHPEAKGFDCTYNTELGEILVKTETK